MDLKLSGASVGPIVGHTTSHSSLIWMRGSTAMPGRTIGVAALYDASGSYIEQSACYLRLQRRYDRTGVVEMKGLNPATSYQVRVGSLTLNAALMVRSDADGDVFSLLPAPQDLLQQLELLPEEISLAKFTTYPPNTSNELSFVFGSCRYPGFLWPAKKSDKIFGAIREQLDKPNPPRFVVMNGDQIYADKLNRHIPFLRADTPAEFQQRYKTAFTSPHMRSLLRSVPTYMILDDHEIEDDWTPSRMDADDKKYHFYLYAIAAYKNYQWIHSPRNYAPRNRDADGAGDRFYYSFECAGFPFFMLDSRTLRIQHKQGGTLEDHHLLGDPLHPSSQDSGSQLDILCDWLTSQQKQNGNRAKFIVSPIMFAPNGIETAGNDEHALSKKKDDDGWAAFPETRRQLLRTIVDGNIQNVIFLSGDAHSSCVAELSFTHKTAGKLPLRAISITSSAFYWPWPFSNGKAESFVHDSVRQNDTFMVSDDVVMDYKAYGFEQENNFSRIDLGERAISVQHYDKDGIALGVKAVLTLSE